MTTAHIRYYIYKFLTAIQMPLALIALFVLPALVQAYVMYYRRYWGLNDANLYFLIGFVAMSAFWLALFMNHPSIFKTMEHEITHAITGWLCFNPPKGMETHDNGSGYTLFAYPPNWLMALSPYFFPLIAWMMIFVGWIIRLNTGETPLWIHSGIGAGIGYNVFSNIEQMTTVQSDFRVAGYVFTAFFLPAANLFSYGWIFSYNHLGNKGTQLFFDLLRENILNYVNYL